MSLKELKLDVEALLSQVVNGKGYLHYGYWRGMDPACASLIDVGIAQQHYFDLFAQHFGNVPGSILDVGSGTGANASELQALGFKVDCVCPSARLNALAKVKLAEGTEIFETTFEAFPVVRAYDALLFAESFHYIRLDDAIPKMVSLKPETIVIFDYFSKTTDGVQEPGTRRSVTEVLDKLQAGLPGYALVENLDATLDIAPTFDVLSRLNTTHVAPFVDRLKVAIRQKRPIVGRVINRIIDAVYKGPRDPNKVPRSVEFINRYEYRLMVFKRAG